jgi:protein-tyrosine phosphatase
MTYDPDQQLATGHPYAIDEGVRMSGTAYHGGYFDVPLIQRVWQRPQEHGGGELWQGGCIDRIRLPEDFDYVLSLYPWEKYVLDPDTERLEVEMYDSLDQATEQADELADLVVTKLRDGGKVLVHCQAGLNRSGLITALALVKLGSTPSEAIDLLRTQRTSQVLCNASFEEHVRSLEHKDELGDRA